MSARHRVSRRAVVLGVLVVAAVGTLVLFTLTRGWVRGETSQQRWIGDAKKLQADREQEIAWSPLDAGGGAASGVEQVASTLRASIETHGIEGDVSFQAERLAETLARQLLARASPRAEDYTRLAETEGTRWIGPEDSDRAWQLIEIRHKALWPDIPFDKAHAREMLTRFVQYQLDEDKSRLVSMGGGPAGAKITLFKARTVDGAMGFNPFPDAEDMIYWFSRSTHSGFRFREPDASIHRTVRKQGFVLCASVQQMVMPENGVPYNWNSMWWWDPEASKWRCERMAATGWNWRENMHY